MARKAMYIVRREIKFTTQQDELGEKLATKKQLTFNQLLRDLLDSAIRIDQISKGMK